MTSTSPLKIAEVSAVSADDLNAAVACTRLARGHRVGDRAAKTTLAHPVWGTLYGALNQTVLEGRPDLLVQWPVLHVVGPHGPEVADIAKKAVDEAGAIVDECPDDPVDDEAAKPKPFSLGVIGSATFAAQRYERNWLVPNVLTAGQPAIVGGPRKGMKTSVMVDLIVSLASATRFLGEFWIARRFKVLLISGESGDATIQETARRICKSKGIDLDELEGSAYWGFHLPQLSNQAHLEVLTDFIRDNKIEVVVVDPLYLCLLSGNSKLDAANLFDTGPLLKRIADVCLEAGATPILVHHLRKNRENPHDPPELEDLAYAGVQEFARQWVMLGRRTAYEPGSGYHQLWLSVGGSAGHSGAWGIDVREGVITEDFRDREWNVKVIKANDVRVEVREQHAAAQAEAKAERAKQSDASKLQRVQDDAQAAYFKLKDLGCATKNQWRASMLTWNTNRLSVAIEWLLQNGWIQSADVDVAAGRGVTKSVGFKPKSHSEGS